MAAVKLYGAVGSGSIAVEAALKLLQLPYTLIEGATWTHKAARERVAPVNAMRQVPTLILPDGEIMTESAAILIDLADRHPTAGLAPAIGDPRRRQFLRWMFYVSSAIYSLHWIKPDVTRIGAPAESRDAVVDAVHELDLDAVLDAELVVPDARGHSDFDELRRRFVMKRSTSIAAAATATPAALVVFDVLQAEDVDTRPLPLSERKAWISANVMPRPGIQIAQSVETAGEALFALAVDQDFEGVVGKKMDAPYLAGLQRTWQKFKNPEYSRPAALGVRDA